MKGLELYNDFITIISAIGNVVLICPYAKKVINFYKDKRFLKNVLGFNDKPVLISHCIFNFSTGKNHEHEYITKESLEATNKVIDLLHRQDIQFTLLDNSDSQNEINIGGMVANKRVEKYFKNHFKTIKYVASKDREEAYKEWGVNREFVEFSTDKTGFKINNKILLETNELVDYALLIKLVPTDFKNENDKTVHIIFGGSNIGTVKAAEYLSTHYKQIYKKYKRNHYFFAIEVNRIDKSINYAKGIIDLSEIMFRHNK